MKILISKLTFGHIQEKLTFICISTLLVYLTMYIIRLEMEKLLVLNVSSVVSKLLLFLQSMRAKFTGRD